MKCIHIITPVKDSIELTLQTVEAIVASDFQTPFTYTVYNDFSTEENTAKLQDASEKLGFELVNLAEITDHPSPNYLLVLQMAQQRAIEAEAGLIVGCCGKEENIAGLVQRSGRTGGLRYCRCRHSR